MIIKNCTLEIDEYKGVLYIHHKKGFSLVRICGLPLPIPKPTMTNMLDITLKLGVKLFSWAKN